MSVKEIKTGQDSFLDIVANLVGILIILVVVVSAQAGTAQRNPEPRPDLIEKVAQLESEISKSADVVTKLERDNHQLEQRIVKEDRLAASLRGQRHEMLVQLEIVKREIEKQRQENLETLESLEAIDAKQREQIKKQNEFETKKRLLENEIAQISRETNAVKMSVPKKKVIDHFPNPIAKTVFSEEVHFRLADGKLSYVPMDELIAQMKSEWRVKSEKLQSANRTIETVGPIGNYRLQYELAAETVRRKTDFGHATSRGVRFVHFSIVPLAREFGEPVAVALAPGSEFQRMLGRHRPGKTTVSIWVYPESFGEHAEVKTWLHENGFQMASWPLENGKRISGGPNGFKTSAQ